MGRRFRAPSTESVEGERERDKEGGAERERKSIYVFEERCISLCEYT